MLLAQDQRAQQRHTGRGGRAGEPAVARDIWHQDGGEPRWQFQPSGLITCLLIKYFLVSKTVFKTQQGEGAKKHKKLTNVSLYVCMSNIKPLFWKLSFKLLLGEKT